MCFVLLSISSNPDLEIQLNPHHSYHKASTYQFSHRIQFSSNPENIPLRWLRILLTTVQCSCSGLDQNLATMLTATAISKHVSWARCNKHPTSFYRKFSVTFFCCDCGLRILGKSILGCQRGVKLHTIWHWKTLKHIANLLRLENRPSSAIFSLIHVYFFHIHLSRLPFLMWDCVEMLVLNAWTTCLSHKGQIVNMVGQNRYSPVILKKEVKARVLLWLFELKLQQSWMKQLVPLLENCFNLTNSSGIHTSFLQ